MSLWPTSAIDSQAWTSRWYARRTDRRSVLAPCGHVQRTDRRSVLRANCGSNVKRPIISVLFLLRNHRFKNDGDRRLQRRDALGVRLEIEVGVVLGAQEWHVNTGAFEVNDGDHVPVVGAVIRFLFVVERVRYEDTAGEHPVGGEVF